MLKIFYSQPFHGKTEEEIFNERERVRDYLARLLDHPTIKIIDQYHQWLPNDVKERLRDKSDVWYMSQDLLKMAEADLVVFANDWFTSSGCTIEMKTCKKYGYNYIVLQPS